MSVHDANYKKIKKELGISEEEPIFIIRAQDDFACAIINRYTNMARQVEDPDKMPSDEWFDHMLEIEQEFVSFRNAHPDRVKVPD